MPPRKKKLITAKEVADILKIDPEVVTYLRQYEDLPYVKNVKYILFSEPEVIRWRNRQLVENSKVVLNLKDYFNSIRLGKFIPYEDFKIKVQEVVFMEGDSVVQYIKRQNPVKDIHNLVGDIVYAYWDAKEKKCRLCGRTLTSAFDNGTCHLCRRKLIKC